MTRVKATFSSADGASEGILPERALQMILGGESAAAANERLSRAALEAWICEPLPEGKAETYNEAARIVAQGMLLFTRKHPELDVRPLAIDPFMKRWEELEPEQYRQVMERSREPTAFQAGWAYNAVRSILGFMPSGNPALAEFGPEEDLDGGE